MFLFVLKFRSSVWIHSTHTARIVKKMLSDFFEYMNAIPIGTLRRASHKILYNCQSGMQRPTDAYSELAVYLSHAK